jgi:hypothetical protein
MDGADRPTALLTEATPSPRRPGRLRAALAIGALMLVPAGIGIWSQLAGRTDTNGPTPERLCALLEGGWTPDQLAGGDGWKSWPDSHSMVSRGIDIAEAADRGGCGDMV